MRTTTRIRNLQHSVDYCYRRGRWLLFFIALLLSHSVVIAQSTPDDITNANNANYFDGQFDFFDFDEIFDDSDTAGGQGVAVNGSNSIGASVEYNGTDTNVDLNGALIGSNAQNDNETFFDLDLTSSVSDVNSLENDMCFTTPDDAVNFTCDVAPVRVEVSEPNGSGMVYQQYWSGTDAEVGGNLS